MSQASLPFPAEDYVIAIGRVSYAVAYLEWAVLGHIPRIPGLPNSFELRALVGTTTGDMGARLQDPNSLAKISDPPTRAWLQDAGKRLSAAAKLRNTVLHARPATVGGQQCLYRWDPNRGQTFVLTHGDLEKILADITDSIRQLGPPPTLVHP